MMRSRWTICALLFFALATGCAHKEQPGPPPALGSWAKSLSVCGISLGMTREEAEQAKRGAPGYIDSVAASYENGRVQQIHGRQLERNGERILGGPDHVDKPEKLGAEGKHVGTTTDYIQEGCKLTVMPDNSVRLVLMPGGAPAAAIP